MDKLSTKEQSISQTKKRKRSCIKRTAAFLKKHLLNSKNMFYQQTITLKEKKSYSLRVYYFKNVFLERKLMN